MNLSIVTPTSVVVDSVEVRYVRAEDATGAFGIQPGHDDFYHAFGSYQNLVGNDNDILHLAKQRVAEGAAPLFYMFCGTEDFGYALNTIARDDLRHLGADVTWCEASGEHGFDCWDGQLPAFLDWLEVSEA